MKLKFGRIGLIVTSVAGLGLSACGGDIMGFKTKRPPDEFTVVRQAPLTLPPDYTLRPPAPGSPRPQDKAVSAEARRLLFDRRVAVSGASSGEAAILKEAGADGADPDIRTTLNRETSALERKNSSFVENLLFSSKAGQQPATVVDATAEAERLKKNQQEGKAPTEGETPSIEPRRKGLLEGLF